MPRESLGFVRMVWVCPNCQNKNPGNFRFCRGCGAPQPPDVQFQADDQDVLLTDAKEIEQAKQGADIHCGYCGARNPAGAKDCVSCGADLATGTPRASGAVGAFRPGAAAEVPCPNCGTLNPANATNCKSCGAPLALRPAVAAPAAVRAFPKWLIFAIGGCLLLTIFLIVMLTRTTASTGTVAQANWERQIEILALQPVERQDWKLEIPRDAKLGTCEERLYTTSDQPEANSKKVCGTPYKIDRGNGYSEVVQDCQYEIYRDYCSYTVMDWGLVNTAVERGGDTGKGPASAPFWPQVSLAQGQREGDRQEIYRITFMTGNGERVFTTRDPSLYDAARPGTRWKLTVNSFGEIVKIEPGG